MIYVPHIHLQSLAKEEVLSAMELGPAGKTWSYVMAPGLFRRVLLQVLHEQRAWAHETHVALEYIPQLRKLIETPAAQKASERGEAVWIGKKISVRITVIREGSELI